MKSLALAILFFAAAASGQPAATPARESTPEVRRKTFEKVWETVRDKFYDPDFNGVDWNKVHERYAPRVESVKTDAELYDLLNDMLGELHTSHLLVFPPDALKSTRMLPASVGIGVETIDNKIVVTGVLPGSSAEQVGLRPGFVITRIDGAPVTTPGWTRALLDGAPQTRVSLEYMDEGDTPHTVTLKRQPLQGLLKDKIGGLSAYALFKEKRLDGGVGYIRFSGFITGLEARIQAAVESMHDAPGLIIDLRGNGGGDSQIGRDLAGMLFDKPTQLMLTRKRHGEDNSYRARPSKNPYLGLVVILVDEDSGSASEEFAAGMQEAGRAFVVGKKTAGALMEAGFAKLPTGAYLQYAAAQPRTPKGVVIEGRGVIPDLEVNLTRAGLLKGDDAQLSAALRYIKQKTSKGTH
jgi:carboxyl-terminal processing protease